MVRLGSVASKALRRLGRGFSTIASPLEAVLRLGQGGPVKPIVILGPARSGTTLVYQCLVTRYEVGYIPNFVSYFPSSCILASHFWRATGRRKRREIEFTSRYGKERGLSGIHQGHNIWRQWFDQDRVGMSLAQKEAGQFTATLAGLERAFQVPIAIKWPGFAVHFSELVEALPNAFFLFVDRDTDAIARSIYRARVDLAGSADIAISRSVDGSHNGPPADAVKSIANYIQGIREKHMAVASRLDEAQHTIVRYEQLCRQPEQETDRVGRMVELWRQEKLVIKGKLPSHFEVSRGPQIDPEKSTVRTT